MKLYKAANEAWDGSKQVSALRAQITSLSDTKPVDEVAKAADDLTSKLRAIGGSAGGRRFGGGGFNPGAPPPPPSFTSVHSSMIRHLDSMDSGDMAPNEAMKKACATSLKNLDTVQANWKVLVEKDLVALNALLTKNNLKPITVAFVQAGTK
jgi:hypothetical protein